MFFRCVGWTAVLVLLASQASCEQVTDALQKSWHEKFNWKAEDYFGDPQVIALCKAIEANDLEEIDRLVAAGADVNAQGKGKMTPLLWAFPDNKPERFKKLLELGADPNVIFESRFGIESSRFAGSSVTHLACETWFPKYFDYVFAHGGDPNLLHRQMHDTPIFLLIRGPARNKRDKLRTLIELGANIDANKDYEPTLGITPAMTAATCFGQFGLALELLNAGADYKAYKTDSNWKLIHAVANAGRGPSSRAVQQTEDYQRLVEWLEAHGESVADANSDIDRWRSWTSFNGEYRRKNAAEVAQRKAREAREKQAAAAGDDAAAP